jgi:hypothetical protein
MEDDSGAPAEKSIRGREMVTRAAPAEGGVTPVELELTCPICLEWLQGAVLPAWGSRPALLRTG